MYKLLVFLLLIGFSASAQRPPNYIKQYSRYNWISGHFDSTLRIPIYGTVPTGQRTNEQIRTGAIAIDSVGNRFYFYSDSAWRTFMTSFSAGHLDPVFTTLVTNPTTAPDLSFNLSSTGNVYRVLGSATNAPPTYVRIDTNYIANFSTQVRPLFSAGSGMTYNSATGVMTATGTGANNIYNLSLIHI